MIDKVRLQIIINKQIEFIEAMQLTADKPTGLAPGELASWQEAMNYAVSTLAILNSMAASALSIEFSDEISDEETTELKREISQAKKNEQERLENFSKLRANNRQKPTNW